MNRLGALLVFKPEVSAAQVECALMLISDLLDPNYWTGMEPYSQLWVLHEFDDEDDGPTWWTNLVHPLRKTE